MAIRPGQPQAGSEPATRGLGVGRPPPTASGRGGDATSGPAGPTSTVPDRRTASPAVVVIVAFTLFAAAGALSWSAFGHRSGGTTGGVGSGSRMGATLHGISLEYPASWKLVDLWPLAGDIALWPEPGSVISVPEGTTERGGLPVLQLSNRDLGLGSACGTDVNGDSAALYVAANGGPYLTDAQGHPRWPGTLTRADGPCGPGWYAYRESRLDAGDGSGEARPYLVYAGFGPDVPDADRDEVFAAFSTLSFSPASDFLHPPAEASPAYVQGTLEDETDTYVFSDVRIEEYPYRERSGDTWIGDPMRALVAWTSSWSGSVYPGEAACTVRVYDAEGKEIGSQDSGYGTYERVSRSSMPVPISPGIPVAAAVRCGPGTKPSGGYEFTNLHVLDDGLPPDGANLVGDISWAGGTPPLTHACVATLELDGAIHTQDFTLSAPEGRDLVITMLPAELSDATPVSVECHPYVSPPDEPSDGASHPSPSPFEWPRPGEGLDLSFPSVDQAVGFLREHLGGEIALPTWVPPGVQLGGGVSMHLGHLGELRTAQIHFTLGEDRSLIIQYGVSALDGCAPEHSAAVTVADQPALLRVSADPSGSDRTWSELIWPATLEQPTGVYGMYGWLTRSEILAMAESMPPASSQVVTELNC
jgi:hypothetical protein